MGAAVKRRVGVRSGRVGVGGGVGAPSVIWVLDELGVVGDNSRDRVTPGGERGRVSVSRPFQHGCWRARQWRELTARTLVLETGGPSRGLPGKALGGQAVDDLGVDASQGVIAAPGKLAGHREGGELAVAAVLDRLVVVAVWAGSPGGALASLEQRPA